MGVSLLVSGFCWEFRFRVAGLIVFLCGGGRLGSGFVFFFWPLDDEQRVSAVRFLAARWSLVRAAGARVCSARV